jgi:hypothetical protein
MQCLVCGEILEKGKGWEHIRAVHLQPLDLTHEKLLAHARKTAHPLEIKTANITCINLHDNIIYFSLDNAELLIAFAQEHGQIPWQEIVAWQILHEKGHLTCRQLYELPDSAKPYILSNAEDYYINKYLLPQKYWRVCLVNARCATRIRSIAPLPYKLRNGYYYCTLATFLAYEAVTLAQLEFLQTAEARFTEVISKFFRKIKEAKDLPLACEEINQAFARLFPPMGISWNSWEISPYESEPN